MKKRMVLSLLLLLFMSFKSFRQANTNTTGSTEALDIMLVLDNSGSMKKNDPQFMMRDVVTHFLEELGNNTYVGCVIFDSVVQLTLYLSSLDQPASQETARMAIQRVDYSGKLTNSPAAIERAIYELRNNGRRAAQKVIIFLTDGVIETGDKEKDREKRIWLKEELAAESRDAGIHIFSIAFTEKADFELIQALGQKTGGGYYRVLEPENIEQVFQKITEELVISTQSTVTTVPSTSAFAFALPPDKLNLVIIILICVLGIILIGIFIVMLSKKPQPVFIETAKKADDYVQEVKIPVDAYIEDIGRKVLDSPYKISKIITTIGRNSRNDIHLKNPFVSDLHAYIEYKEPNFYLIDKNSGNKTALNSVLLEAYIPAPLKNGDKITVSKKAKPDEQYQFEFVLSDLDIGKKRTNKTILAVPSQSTEPITQLTSSSSMPENQDPVKTDGSTIAEPKMCPNHPQYKPTHMCSSCKKAFCRQCVAEIGGEIFICHECTEKKNLQKHRNVAPAKRKQSVEQYKVFDHNLDREIHKQDMMIDKVTIEKPIVCPRHPGKKPQEVCETCGSAICSECVNTVDGKNLCSDCQPAMS